LKLKRTLKKLISKEREDSIIGGTVVGGFKTAETNKRKYGSDYYQRIGSYGGQSGKADGTIKGFALMDKAKVSEAGRKGGTISRRGPKLPDPKPTIISRIWRKIRGL
jgi:general stress protein YciG